MDCATDLTFDNVTSNYTSPMQRSVLDVSLSTANTNNITNPIVATSPHKFVPDTPLVTTTRPAVYLSTLLAPITDRLHYQRTPLSIKCADISAVMASDQASPELYLSSTLDTSEWPSSPPQVRSSFVCYVVTYSALFLTFSNLYNRSTITWPAMVVLQPWLLWRTKISK